MSCGNNIYKSGCNPSKEFADQLMQQIATRSVRDTDLPVAGDLSGDEYIAIVQGGKNRKIKASDLISQLSGSEIKVGTTAYWNSQIGFIPDSGTVIIYSDYSSVMIDGNLVDVPGIKVGSGNGYVQDLAFVGQDIASSFIAHITNTSIHTTAEEKMFWNRKLNVTDNQEVIDEVLIFHRN